VKQKNKNSDYSQYGSPEFFLNKKFKTPYPQSSVKPLSENKLGHDYLGSFFIGKKGK
jgi:hypothetical protein